MKFKHSPDGEDGEQPEAWRDHPLVNVAPGAEVDLPAPTIREKGLPEVPPHLLTQEKADLLATAHIREAADREIDADIWGGDEQTHVDKRVRPKGAPTIRGTDWTPAGDDAGIEEKMDKAA